jgi:hypothetical protein
MTRNSTVSDKTSSVGSVPSRALQKPIEPGDNRGEYQELIQRLFHSPTAVAVVSSGSREGSPLICDGIAKELAASGKFVVVVQVNTLLGMNPILPDETAFMPGKTPHVWLWPSAEGGPIEFFKFRESGRTGNWLDALRQNFDSVLLDCPAAEMMPSVTAVAAMADAAVLVVEAGRTAKQEIQRDQRALQAIGVYVAGSILIRR